MMKKALTLVFAVLICFCLLTPALAEGQQRLLVDDADLLTPSEESELEEILREISDRQEFAVVVVTADTLYGKSPMNFADDFYDENGYGYGADKDGVLLLVSMEERDWWISTTGYGITAITDAGREYISDRFLDDLSDGNYFRAFSIFAGLCDDFVTEARQDQPYDTENLPKESSPIGWLIAAVFIGAAVSTVICLVMKSSLKSVVTQTSAGAYMLAGSLKVNESKDLFLYAQTHRSPIPKSNSTGGGSITHTSFSGTTHGGGGGKF